MELLGSYGYLCLETPILEPTELFLRKSGGELASRLYSFTDVASNSVSLRPEFTSPIMRYYVEHASEIELPARWQYSGPVFRYEDGFGGGQFTQLGCELLGSASIMADVELLGLAALVPSHLGLDGWRLDLADLDVLHSVLDGVGVSERARNFIVSRASLLRDGRRSIPRVLEEARRLHLAGYAGEDDYLGEAIQGLNDGQAKTVLRGLVQWTASDQVGQRDPDEVVDRLLRKLRGSDDENRLQRGLELASDLVAVRGDPQEGLESVRAVVQESGADPAAFDRLEEFLSLLSAGPDIAGHVNLDFGLARGLAYYNGIVFQITHPSQPTPLGGGGRYDGLARALGSPEPVPALGFAYNLEALLQAAGDPADGNGASEASNYLGQSAALVLADGPGSCRRALEASNQMRREGQMTELEVNERTLEQALAYANRKRLSQVVVVHQDGRRTAYPVE